MPSFDRSLGRGDATLHAMPATHLDASRRSRLRQARLYLVCDRAPGERTLDEVLPAAIAGGVDAVQLRQKHLDGEQLMQTARHAAEICARHGTLFIVNDHPHVAVEVGADGVHVGQDDMPVAQVRQIVGSDMLVGLSTHAPLEIDAAIPTVRDGFPHVDYIGVGPVHATPTKPGRPAVGTELVSYASAHAHVPFFAIGGIDEDNVLDVLYAGASRICVLRAIADAEDPRSAAAGLRAAID
jgi:thiamine-phosphate pyrophosphorylase